MCLQLRQVICCLLNFALARKFGVLKVFIGRLCCDNAAINVGTEYAPIGSCWAIRSKNILRTILSHSSHHVVYLLDGWVVQLLSV